MELGGKGLVSCSKGLIFAGFLMSTSMTLCSELPPHFFYSLPSFLWISILVLVLIVYAIGFTIYFFTKTCSYLLQVCEYVLFPLASFAAIQKVYIYRNTATPQSLMDLIYALVLFALIALATAFKIACLNQVFPGECHKQILQFELAPRLFRLLKLCMNAITIFIFNQNENKSYLPIAFAVMNLLDFLILSRKFTFVDLQLESAVVLVNFNNLASICAHTLIISQHQVIGYCAAEILFVFLLCTFDQIAQYVLQFKCGLWFRNCKFDRNNFDKKQSKNVIILLLTCFNSIYSFQLEQKIIKKEELKWSNSFIMELKSVYKTLLTYFLVESIVATEDESFEASFTYADRKSLSNTLEQKYFLIYGKKQMERDILANKALFYNFVAFCMDRLQRKEAKNFPWSNSSQFFLTLAPKLCPKFLMKNSLYYYQRLTLKNQSLPFRSRNEKHHQYLNYYKKSSQMQASPQEHYMKFSYHLEQLKQNLHALCLEEIKIVEQLGNMTVCLDYERHLRRRQDGKETVNGIIQACFLFGEYLYFEQFTYLYLLFKILFCKSIYRTSKQIHKYFLMAKKDIALSTPVSSTPIVVSCGLQNEQENTKFGQIMMSNTAFRKKFGLCSSEILHSKKKISDLIVGVGQKERHLELMIASCRFSEYVVTVPRHSEYHCMLKINLEFNNLHVFKEFKVATRVFYSYSDSLMHLCKLQAINDDSYILSSQYPRLFKYPVNPDSTAQISHSQLNTTMKLVKISPTQMRSLAIIRQSQQYDMDDTMEGGHTVKNVDDALDDQEHRFSAIEDVLFHKESFGDRKLVKYLLLTVLALLAMLAVAGAGFGYSHWAVGWAKEMQGEVLDAIIETQDCPLQIAVSLDVRSRVYAGEIGDYVGPSIPSLDQYTKERVEDEIDGLREYLRNYRNSKLRVVPIYDYAFWDTVNTDLPSQGDIQQFSYYLLTLSTIANEYIETDPTALSPAEQSQLASFIASHSSAPDGSLSMKLLTILTKLSSNFLSSTRLHIQIFSLLTVLVMTVLALSLLLFLLRCYYEYVQYIELLFKIGEQYLYRRAQEMKFIIKQILAMKDYNFTKCEFLSCFEVKFYTLRGLAVEENVVNLREFQNIVQSGSGQAKIVVQMPCFQGRVVFGEVVRGKRGWFGVGVACCVGLLAVAVVNGRTSLAIIDNNLSLNQLMSQGQKTRSFLLHMTHSNWLNSSPQPQTQPLTPNSQIFQQARLFLGQKTFFNLLISTMLKEQAIKGVVNLNICELLDRTGLAVSDRGQCDGDLGRLSTETFTQLMTVYLQGQEMIWNQMGADRKGAVAKLCESMRILQLYLDPSIQAILKSLHSSFNQTLQSSLKTSLTTFACLALLTVTITLVHLHSLHHSLTQTIKFQIFTFDAPADLYSNAAFRPHLNRMFYHEFQYQ